MQAMFVMVKTIIEGFQSFKTLAVRRKVEHL